MFPFYFLMKARRLSLRLHAGTLAGFIALALPVFSPTPLTAQQGLTSHTENNSPLRFVGSRRRKSKTSRRAGNGPRTGRGIEWLPWTAPYSRCYEGGRIPPKSSGARCRQPCIRGNVGRLDTSAERSSRRKKKRRSKRRSVRDNRCAKSPRAAYKNRRITKRASCSPPEDPPPNASASNRPPDRTLQRTARLHTGRHRLP